MSWMTRRRPSLVNLKTATPQATDYLIFHSFSCFLLHCIPILASYAYEDYIRCITSTRKET